MTTSLKFIAAMAAAAGATFFAVRAPTRSLAPSQTAPASAVTAEPQFILLIMDGATVSGTISADFIRKVVGEHRDWATRLRNEGRLVAAEKLTDDAGKAIAVDKATEAAVGGTASSVAHLGGFYIIHARDYDEASRIAREGPILKYGGSVVVRMIEKT